MGGEHKVINLNNLNTNTILIKYVVSFLKTQEVNKPIYWFQTAILVFHFYNFLV